MIELGPAVKEAGAKKYARDRGLPLMFRSVSEWLPIKDKG